MTQRIFFLLCLVWMTPVAAFAQKAPELGYVFPPAIEAGKSTAVQLGGYDFTPDMQFFAHHAQVKLKVTGELGDYLVPGPPYWFGEKSRLTAFPIPREIGGEITVAPKTSPGLVRWQVANANGASATGTLLVSELPEIVEDRFRDQPQQLEQIPVGVSGRLERITEVDRYAFVAAKTGPMSIELFARRLNANFNGILEVRDSAGNLITDAADTEGRDACVTFAAKKDERYTVSLHDVDFRGNRAFVYRLAFHAGPRVAATLPAFGQRGAKQRVQFFGVGIATGSAKLESVERVIQFPADKTQSALRYQLSTPHGNAIPISIPLSGHPESIRQGDDATPLTTPIGITGRLEKPATHLWEAKKGTTYRLDAMSHALGGQLDLSLEIQDADGKRLAGNDDLPGTPDAGLDFKPKADGTYRCVVSDLSGQSLQAPETYRLAIQPVTPSVTLSVPQRLNVNVGSVVQLQVTANRRGGHKDPIDLRLVGLPKGVTAPGELRIAEGKKSVKIPLTCAPTAATTAAAIRVLGKTPTGDQLVASATAAGNLATPVPAQNTIEDFILATTLAPLFSVELIDKNRQRAVHRGTTYPAPFIIKRSAGFDGEIILRMAAKQGRHRQGIYSPEVSVPGGAGEVLYPCFMPEWLETDRTTRMVVLGVGKQRDPQGNIRHITKPADARITMILEGALLSLEHEANEITVAAGESFEIPVRVSRSPKLNEDVDIRLIVPDELKGLVSAPELHLSKSSDRGALAVSTSASPRMAGRWNLEIQARSLQDSRWLVVSQTDVTVELQPAANSNNADSNN